MPNKPRTPHRSVRVDDDLWEQAKRAASDQGEAVSDVVRRALEKYVADWLANLGHD